MRNYSSTTVNLHRGLALTENKRSWRRDNWNNPSRMLSQGNISCSECQNVLFADWESARFASRGSEKHGHHKWNGYCGCDEVENEDDWYYYEAMDFEGRDHRGVLTTWLLIDSIEKMHKEGFGEQLRVQLANLSLHCFDKGYVPAGRKCVHETWRLEDAVQYLSEGDNSWVACIWTSPSTVRKVIKNLADHVVFHPSEAGLHSDWTMSLLAQLAVLQPFWLRTIESWRPRFSDSRRNVEDLTRHLLIRYPVPAWLAPETSPIPAGVFVGWDGLRGHHLLLLMSAGRGWSLREAIQHIWSNRLCIPAKPSVTRHAMTVPAGASIEQARFWMIVHALGGDSALYAELEPLINHAESPLFISLIPWLMENRQNLAAGQTILISLWAEHERYEAERTAANDTNKPKPFSMRGRSFARALHAATEYSNTRYHDHGLLIQWNSQGLDWEGVFGDEKWRIKELCTGALLNQESAAMHHCVVGYAEQCAGGNCAIFSVTVDGHRRLTVELRPKTRQVVQIKGTCNRYPMAAELEVIEFWKRERIDQSQAIPLEPV